MRWEDFDQDQIDRLRERPGPDGNLFKGVVVGSLLAAPCWAFLWLCGRLGGIW